MVVSTEDPDSEKVVYLNMYTIGEKVRVGRVWEPPMRSTPSDQLKKSTRSHNTLNSLPTLRAILVPDHV